MTELIEKIFLDEHKQEISSLAEGVENLINLVGQLQKCTSFESLRDSLNEIAQEANSVARGIEEDFDID